MTRQPLNVGDVIRGYGHKKNNRPGVILRTQIVRGVEYLFIGYGTTQAPLASDAALYFDPSVDGYQALGLTHPTWFKATNTALLRSDSDSIDYIGPCPPRLFVEFRKHYGFK